MALAAAGCASAPPGSLSLSELPDPLIRAFSTRLEVLEQQVVDGDTTAMMAMSVLKAEGLRGASLDPVGASELKRRSVAGSGPTQIVQYIPGINGAPGRTVPLMIPGDGRMERARRMDACVAALKAGAADGPALDKLLDALDSEDGYEAYQRRQDEAAAACGGAKTYGLLLEQWIFARPWSAHALPDCEDEDVRCRVLGEKIDRLNRRDPVREAKEAAAAGDFRLGATNHIGPAPTGWSMPGVTCSLWARDMIGKWHVNQDYIQPGDSEHSAASTAFIAAYNRALIADARFPFADVCGEGLAQPLPRYEGAVRTWGQAARTGDPARLSEIPSGADLNARDELGATALDWAMRRADEVMTVALLDAGAGAEIGGADQTEPSPLALALVQKKPALAERLIAAGAEMKAGPRTCRYGPYGGPEPGRNHGCSWSGLMIQAGAFDLLERRLAVTNGEGEAFNNQEEMVGAYLTAMAAGDEAMMDRLTPLLARLRGMNGYLLQAMYTAGRTDRVSRYIWARTEGVGRSDAEAGLWRAAAEKGHAETIAFLWTYGADLNLLPAKELEVCAEAAGRGDEAALLSCVERAGQRRLRLHEAIKAGDATTFDSMVAEAADLKERGKAGLLHAAVDHGSLAMVQALLARGASPNPSHSPAPETAAYAGALKAQADAVTAASDYASNQAPGELLVVRAAKRGDVAVLRALTDAGAAGLSGAVAGIGGLGNPPAGLEGLYRPDAPSSDNEGLPNRVLERDFDVFRLLVAEAARIEGPQSLEAAFASGVYSGYNDALQVMLDNGLDLSKAKKPERIWSNLGGLGTPCKPSTARLLIAGGLPARHEVSDYTRWPPLHAVAASCADARVVEILVREGGQTVNEVSVDGETALDLAVSYRRAANAEVLRRLGGMTAAEADPAGHQARAVAARTEGDLDLIQNEET